MVNLIYTEILKLKRSQMFLISFLGAAAAPFIGFISSMAKRAKQPEIPLEFGTAFAETNLYIVSLIGVCLYGVITAYLYNREYAEGALKNLLTIPVSRVSLIASKLILLFFWIMILTAGAWALTLLFGLVGQYENLSNEVLVKSLKEYLTGGVLLYLLSTPIILITLVMKNFVPAVVICIALTMVNLMIYGTEYSALFPWSAVQVISTQTFFSEYPPFLSYISVLGTSLLGFAASVLYFKRVDIH